LLRQQLNAGASIEELAEFLQRQPGAIRSQLRKLDIGMDRRAQWEIGTNIDMRFSFERRAVLRESDEVYSFPEPITGFMIRRYSCPAVYRWNVLYRSGETFPELMYIGSTKRLCPARLEGYLNPRTSKTNRRLHEQFTKCVRQGFQIHLEMLEACEVTIGELALSSFDFGTNTTRLFVENLLITYYRRKGYTLLNRN
jgi:hypothetical protein